MYPRPFIIRLDLTPPQAEYLYWECLGLQAHYDSQGLANPLTTDEALTLANTINRLHSQLEKARALADVQLERLKRTHSAAEGA